MGEVHWPGVAVLILASSLEAAPALDIEHQPVTCAVAGKFPRLEARFSAPETVAAARVVFQGQTAAWYSVAMKLEGSAFAGVLPQPKKDLQSFRYYIEVTDKALGTNRTAEFTTNVVERASACQGRLMAGALGSASVLLQGPAGVAALPAGFASAGVVAGSAAGTSAGAAGAAVGGGGGLSTGAIVGIVAGAGAVAGGVVVASSKGDESSDTAYTGAISGQYVRTQDVISPVGTAPRTCLHNWSFSGTVTVRLRSSGGGSLQSSGNQSETGVTGGATCSSPGPGGNLFLNCTLSGSSNDFSCSEQSTTTSGIQTNTEMRSFSGTLNGGVVSGVMTYTVRGQSAGVNSGGNYTTTDSASVSIPVTLR